MKIKKENLGNSRLAHVSLIFLMPFATLVSPLGHISLYYFFYNFVKLNEEKENKEKIQNYN